jgi:hypothetical protein
MTSYPSSWSIARARVGRIVREHVLEAARRRVAVERVDVERREVEHLENGFFDVPRFEQYVAQHLAHVERSGFDFEPHSQRLDRLRIQAHPPERRRVRQHLRELLAHVGRRHLAVRKILRGDRVVTDDHQLGRRRHLLARAICRRGTALVAHRLARVLRGGAIAPERDWLGVENAVLDIAGLDGLVVEVVERLRLHLGVRRLGSPHRHRRDRGREELPHPLVVRRRSLELLEELLEQLRLPLLAGDLRHLLLNFDPLARLADRREGAREEREGVEILRVRLEADLQPRQRLHAVVLLVAREVKLGRDPRVHGVGAVMEQALDDLQRIIPAAETNELRRGEAELGDRGLVVLHSRQRLGEAQVGERVGGIELDDLAEDVDRFLVLVLPLEAGRHFVEGGEGVAGQPELLVELGELRRDVPVALFELRRVLRDQLADLLVDGDRFEREPLARVELSDPLVRADGVGVGLHLGLEVPDLEQSPSVVRILCD